MTMVDFHYNTAKSSIYYYYHVIRARAAREAREAREARRACFSSIGLEMLIILKKKFDIPAIC